MSGVSDRVVEPTRIDHVELRVSDLDRSIRFYRQLFGLSPSPGLNGSSIELMSAPTGPLGVPFRLVLTKGLPLAMPLAGIDHIALEVDTTDQIDAIHERARTMGGRATRPRSYDQCFQTFVFDPDGYKIEVLYR